MNIHLSPRSRLSLVPVLLVLAVLCGFTACGGDDDEPLPPYRQILCELLTDSTGHACSLRYDDGRTVPIVNKLKDLTPDSLYRISTTTLEYAHGVELYNTQPVFSPMPVVFRADKLKTDPVTLLTAWREPRYINLRLSVDRGAEARHYMAFADQGIMMHPNGTRVKTLRFYHDANGDEAHYRQETIVSCPVYQCSSELRHGRDSIRMIVNTPAGESRLVTVY